MLFFCFLAVLTSSWRHFGSILAAMDPILPRFWKSLGLCWLHFCCEVNWRWMGWWGYAKRQELKNQPLSNKSLKIQSCSSLTNTRSFLQQPSMTLSSREFVCFCSLVFQSLLSACRKEMRATLDLETHVKPTRDRKARQEQCNHLSSRYFGEHQQEWRQK